MTDIILYISIIVSAGLCRRQGAGVSRPARLDGDRTDHGHCAVGGY